MSNSFFPDRCWNQTMYWTEEVGEC